MFCRCLNGGGLTVHNLNVLVKRTNRLDTFFIESRKNFSLQTRRFVSTILYF